MEKEKAKENILVLKQIKNSKNGNVYDGDYKDGSPSGKATVT